MAATQRASGALFGMAFGDALGARCDFTNNEAQFLKHFLAAA